MSEIAIALGYPQSSATVLLKTLVSLGYLNFDRRERVYFPTQNVTALGDWIPRALYGNSRMLDAMRDVHAATGESTGISTQNDIYLQYVQALDSVHPLRFYIEEGSLRPLTQSGIGWTLMSVLSDERIDNIVRRTNIASDKSGRVTTAFIMDRIREIREKGFCYSQDVPFLGGATLSMLLPVKIHNQAAAMSLGGAKERIRENYDRYFSILRRSVKSIKAKDSFEQPIDIDL
jgi:DNA-binding IclR family transcriptional regulator